MREYRPASRMSAPLRQNDATWSGQPWRADCEQAFTTPGCHLPCPAGSRVGGDCLSMEGVVGMHDLGHHSSASAGGCTLSMGGSRVSGCSGASRAVLADAAALMLAMKERLCALLQVLHLLGQKRHGRLRGAVRRRTEVRRASGRRRRCPSTVRPPTRVKSPAGSGSAP